TLGDVSRIPLFVAGEAGTAAKPAAVPRDPLPSAMRNQSADALPTQSVAPPVPVEPPRSFAPPPPAYASPEREVAFWNSVKETSDPAEVEEFLKHFGDGPFGNLARIRLDKLKKLQHESEPFARPPMEADP